MRSPFFVILLSFVAFQLAAQVNTSVAKADPLLLEKFAEGPVQEALIVFQAKADISSAKQLATKNEKGTYVFTTLEKVAKASQGKVIAYLQNNSIAFKSFSIVNAIYAKLTMTQIEELLQFTEVKSINANPTTSFPQPIAARPEAAARGAVEWGLAMIGAPEVWAMGITGENAIVGGQDTGYEWDHPALQTKYRGWNNGAVDHNYNWHDAIHEISPLHGDSIPDPALNPCGLDIEEPCDDNSHGTHTMGTMVGSEGENEIGVAPGAKWIGVRNMERGYGSPATYIEGYEWFLAPTDLNNENPDPTKAPHVINNSWSCPTMEGCELSNFGLLEEAVNNLKMAGVVVVVSAGNSGPGCSSINTPSAIFENSFSVGATRSNDTIANFSSRGPVIIDGSNRMKPNISAPGQGVRSAVLDGGYGTKSGTSMAGPHVAGVVALMISANPLLSGNVEAIEDIIESSAVAKTSDQECGGIAGTEVPNHTYGHGRIDALAAVNDAMTFGLNATKELGNYKTLHFFPNPARESIQIQLEELDSDAEMRLFSQTGIFIRQETVTSSIHQLNVANLPAGVYFIQVSSGERLYQGKLVKI